MIIKDIDIEIIKDSRGKETLRAWMRADSLIGELVSQAAVPSGKSTGSNEAHVLDPSKALERFQEIKPQLLGKDFDSQAEFDDYLIRLDATENKSNLGGNLILSLSLSFARLKARHEGRELFEYIGENIEVPSTFTGRAFPYPILNVVNGGAHADNNLEFQEFQIIPQAGDFKSCMEIGKKFYAELEDAIKKKFKDYEIKLGDEAGYSAPFQSNEEAIKFIYELIKRGSYPIRIGLDTAANYFYKDKSYMIGGKNYSAKELLAYYNELVDKYEIISIEDPFDEGDFDDFEEILLELKAKHKDIFIITDDLTTTNPKRLEMAIRKRSGDAVLVKLNQIGTLTETLKVVRMAHENGWQAVVSHRSGETEDDFIADLAVGVRAWGIKSGAPATPYRMNKYDRVQAILEIEG